MEDLIYANRLALEMAQWPNDREHRVIYRADLELILQLVERTEPRDPFHEATILLTGIIICHPFADGNHRTGFLAAQTHLLVNGYLLTVDNEDAMRLYDWRFEQEEERHLKQEWVNSIGGFDEPQRTRSYILGFQDDYYSYVVREFLKTYAEPIGDPTGFLGAFWNKIARALSRWRPWKPRHVQARRRRRKRLKKRARRQWRRAA